MYDVEVNLTACSDPGVFGKKKKKKDPNRRGDGGLVQHVQISHLTAASEMIVSVTSSQSDWVTRAMQPPKRFVLTIH